MSLINVFADKIPMNWVDTKAGKKKFCEFKKAGNPSGIIYYGLMVKVPEEDVDDLVEAKEPWDGTETMESFGTYGLPTLEEAFQDAAGSLMGNGIGGEGLNANETGLFEAEPIPDEKALFEMEMSSQFMSEGEEGSEDGFTAQWESGKYKNILKTANNDGIDLYKYDPNEVRMGLDVELEHGTAAGEYDITNNDPLMTLKIVLTHLDENPHYYTLLYESGIEDGVEELDETDAMLPGAEDFATQDPNIVLKKGLNEGFRIMNGKLYDGAGQMIGDEKGIIPFKDRKPYGKSVVKEDTFDTNGLCGTTPGMSKTQGNFNEIKRMNEDDYFEPKEKPITGVKFDDQRVSYLEMDLNKMLKLPRYMDITYIYRVGRYTYEVYLRSEDGKNMKKYYMDLDLGGQNYGPSDVSEDDNGRRTVGEIPCWDNKHLDESVNDSITDKIIAEAMGELPDGSGFMTGTIK